MAQSLFLLALSDKIFEAPGAYTKKYEVQTLTVAFTGTDNPAQTIRVDNIPVSLPAQGADLIAAYNGTVGDAIRSAFSANTKFTVAGTGASVTFTRKTSYGTFPLIEIKDSAALTLAQITAAITTKGALTAAADMVEAMKLDNQTMIFDSKGSYINGVEYLSVGLKGGLKSDPKEVTTDPDNNGTKQVEMTITGAITNVNNDTDANTIRAAIDSLIGTRKYIYFIDTTNGLYIRHNLFPINILAPFTGNEETTTPISAVETGFKSNLIKVWTML